MGKMKDRKMAVKSLRHVMLLVEAEMAADGCRHGPKSSLNTTHSTPY
jgi:hypothetical protein